MPIINYDNYDVPFAQVEQPEPSWYRRNWNVIIQILGYIFLVGGVVAKQIIDENIPKEPIPPDDWQMLIQAAQKAFPNMTRADIEARLCDYLGDRAPAYCRMLETPIIEKVEPEPKFPTWLLLVGLGAAALFLLR